MDIAGMCRTCVLISISFIARYNYVLEHTTNKLTFPTRTGINISPLAELTIKILVIVPRTKKLETYKNVSTARFLKN